MSSKTKILLLKKRECLYTLLFLALGILLIILMILMFLPALSSETASASYTPGIYTSQLVLQDTVMDVEVRTDHSGIHSIGFRSLSDSISAMYPVVQTSLNQLAKQICDTQSLENIYYEKSNQYTAQMLLDTIRCALQMAQ